jgi:hypothetical protein
MTSEAQIDEEFDRRTENNSNFYLFIKGILWNRDIQKQCKEYFYTGYFKPIATPDTKVWTLTERNKSKTHVGYEILRSSEGKNKKGENKK